MRTIFSKFLILPALAAIISCSSSNTPSKDETINHDYHEVEAFMIRWNEIFLMESNQYFVYFYSLTCSHCKKIKDQVIEYALDNENMYFVKFNDEVKVSPDIKNTIGATSVSDLAILGTPSLVEIANHVVATNIAGTKMILDFLQIPSSD